MRLKIIRGLVNHLADRNTTEAFMEVVELRQRLYSPLREDVLILDAYDLISDHILLYSETDGALMGYIRSVTEKRCRDYRQDLPISGLVANFPECQWGYRQFRKHAGDVLQVFYLCVDPRYKAELAGVKAVDLFVWLAMTASGVDPSRLSFACTINNRYRQDEVLRLLGEWIPEVPDIDHPVIPDRHRFVFVPQIREAYWEERRAEFARRYTSLSDGTFDWLSPAAAERMRKAS